MSIATLPDKIKNHPDFDKVGMVLCHNGVVRGTARDGRKVKGLRVAVNHEKLEQIIREQEQKPGMIDIRVNQVTEKTEYFTE